MKKRTVNSHSLYPRIYSLVRTIPAGRVSTYGRIARLAGLGNNYRLVGYALNKLPENSDVPWHRVVNRFGKISYTPRRGGYDRLQRILLEQEGIIFDENEKIDLSKFAYRKKRVSKNRKEGHAHE